MISNVGRRIIYNGLTVLILSIFFLAGGVVGINMQNIEAEKTQMTLQLKLLKTEQQQLSDRIVLLTSCAEGSIISVEGIQFVCMPVEVIEHTDPSKKFEKEYI